MAMWCHPEYSLSRKWRLPFPRKDWHEEATLNKFLLEAMIYALAADAVFSTPGEDWGEHEITFYNEHLAKLDKLKNGRKATEREGDH